MAEAEESGADIETIQPLSVTEAADLADGVIDRLGEAVVADRRFFELLLTGIIARGHIQLEDVPGTGKTLAAQVLAEALGVSFSRVQFTPDLLPADITGSHVYDETTGEFDFQRGPVFANIVLADEINRAPPKTQAALLEAMGERQVSVDGTSYQLPRPFFVIATQNPIEQEGTFELPEAQRDRFSIKTEMGYPGHEGELELLDRRENRRRQVPSVDPVTDRETVGRLQVTAEEIVGLTIREIGPELPEGCLIALVSRNGDTRVPNADFTVEAGDRVTVIGDREDVRKAMAYVHPEE
mgnify:CR=1 FL=1